MYWFKPGSRNQFKPQYIFKHSIKFINQDYFSKIKKITNTIKATVLYILIR